MQHPNIEHPSRPDIEGLRAIAVGAVVVHHTWPEALPGGFAGVDVFFVISGFLIGQQLLSSDLSSAAWLAFWRRRVRRILPALSAVGFGCALVFASFSTTAELESLGLHILAGTSFISNFLLSRESGYFDAPASSKPLLHLWSLSIELQFYALIPLVLALGRRAEGWALAWAVRLGAASLVWLLLAGSIDPIASFYFLPTRFWELAAGLLLAGYLRREVGPKWRLELTLILLVVCAAAALALMDALQASTNHSRVAALLVLLLLVVGMAGRSIRRSPPLGLIDSKPAILPRTANWLATAGLGGVLFSLCFATSTDWPGADTLWPVLGTLALLAAGPQTVLARWVSRPGWLFVGGISYPLYLWHWPVLVAWRAAFGPFPWFVGCLLVLAAIALAWVTKRRIEDPIRSARRVNAANGSQPIAWLAAAHIGVAGLGAWAWLGKGLPWRLPRAMQEVASWAEPVGYNAWRLGACYYYLNSTKPYAKDCTPTEGPGAPVILLWGDSHAGHLYPGLQSEASSLGFRIAQWTMGSCPPTLSMLVGEGTLCNSRRRFIHDQLDKGTPETAIVAAYWQNYLQQNTEAQVRAAVIETVTALHRSGSKRVLLFGPGPIWNVSLQAELLRHMLLTHVYRVPSRLKPQNGDSSRVDAEMSAIAKEAGAEYVSVLSVLCNEQGCLTSKPGPHLELLYFDGSHLNVTGSELLMRATAPQVLGTPETADPRS